MGGATFGDLHKATNFANVTLLTSAISFDDYGFLVVKNMKHPQPRKPHPQASRVIPDLFSNLIRIETLLFWPVTDAI